MPDRQTLLVEQRGAVTLITLNRTQALNALNTQVLADLIAALGAFDRDDSQRCAVLTGSDKAFAAGADIKEMQALEFADVMGGTSLPGSIKSPPPGSSGWLQSPASPLAAAANWDDGGLHRRRRYARFGQPEIRLGVTPGMGGTQRLTRAVGKAKAMEMCLTGRMMDAREAEAAGLVARVVPAGELLDTALKIAGEIAAMPPLAALANKEQVNAAFETTLTHGILFERRLFNGVFASEDRKEGMADFVEKRAPNWKGL